MADQVAPIRQALADALRAVGDISANAYAMAQPTPPGVQILPPAISYDYAVGFDLWTWTVQGFVALTGDIGPQMLLDRMITRDGVKAALEADRTLGGLCDQLTVEGSGPPRQVETVAGSPMLLVEWRLTMYVTGG